MARLWFALGMLVSQFGVISAQDPMPPVPSISRTTDALLVAGTAPSFAPASPGAGENVVYMMEMRVLEGTGLIADGSAQRTVANLRRRATAGTAEIATELRAVPAPLPHPHGGESRPAWGVATASAEDLWDDALAKRGITVLAAPKVALVTKTPATVQIATEQVFSYLVPSGNGKFEARHSAAQELGMKFDLQVQPVEGDEADHRHAIAQNHGQDEAGVHAHHRDPIRTKDGGGSAVASQPHRNSLRHPPYGAPRSTVGCTELVRLPCSHPS